MKKQWKTILSLFCVILGCLLTLLSIGYCTLVLPGKSSKNTTGLTRSEPYSPETPRIGILCCLPDKNMLLFTLNFTAGCITVSPFSQDTETDAQADYVLEADYPLIAGIVDRSGGVELTLSGEPMRYTGIQIVELLSVCPDALPLHKKIVEAILYNIAANGISRQDFIYIIENSKTDLTVPVCFSWNETVPPLCKNVRLTGWPDSDDTDGGTE